MKIRHSIRRCINCSLKLVYSRWRSINDANEKMLDVLRSWISPTPISIKNSLCLECFTILLNVADDESTPAPMFGHRSVCFGCGVSILRTRSHLIKANSPQWEVIIGWIPPHLVKHLVRVCKPCWMSATRHFSRQQQFDNIKLVDVISEPMAENNEIVPNIAPELPPLPTQHYIPQAQDPVRPTINSAMYKHAANSTRHCIFNNCVNVESLLIPAAIKEMLLSCHKFYIPPSARICQYHLDNNCWEQLVSNNREFTGAQMDNMLSMLENIRIKTLDFSNIFLTPLHLCYYWLGLTLVQFNALLLCVPMLRAQVSSATIALSIYLAKLRT